MEILTGKWILNRAIRRDKKLIDLGFIFLSNTNTYVYFFNQENRLEISLISLIDYDKENWDLKLNRTKLHIQHFKDGKF